MLEGLVVVELGSGVTTALATRTMAGFGAEVVKVEPPEGDCLRHVGAFPDGRTDGESSAAHLYFNGGKSSVVLDLRQQAARSALTAIVSAADLLVTDRRRGELEALGLDEPRLAAGFPKLSVVAVTPYGEDGPKADHLVTELTTFAAGGQLSLMGSPDREPVKPYGDQAGCQAALSVLGAAMTAVLRQLRTGRSSYVELALQELQASAMDMQGPMAYNGDPPYPGYGKRIGNSTHSLWSYYPSRDGDVGIFVNPTNIDSFLAAIGRPDLRDRMSDKTFLAGEMRDLVGRWCAERTNAEVHAAAVEHGAPFSYVARPADLLADPTLAETGIWHDIDAPGLGRLRVPGAPFAGSEPFELAPAPQLGQHTTAVLARYAGAIGEDTRAIVGGWRGR
ncbi:CaiB/BaiF CoA transferase family protein [Embleya scabrispora]|uniref:CaiB/BaiF CoA transferase family protein n=1 Tax=Embleya scabrispora TaxID=159449 RepID=UPI00039AE0A6|nr:CoA transferase [Embleya scabrispora]MYS79200.1 CoA transferase [Streptomyces sp. SID5474]